MGELDTPKKPVRIGARSSVGCPGVLVALSISLMSVDRHTQQHAPVLSRGKRHR